MKTLSKKLTFITIITLLLTVNINPIKAQIQLSNNNTINQLEI